ncbi:MAG: CoA ester lyase, partial [Hyphomicrobiaceae bacterium]
AHAGKVLAAAARADGAGAFVVDGRMIDAPFIRRAQAIMSTADRLGSSPSDDGLSS